VTQSKPSSSVAGKPAVKTSSMPVKSAAAQMPQGKPTPVPVVPAKVDAKTANTKKTDTKKADTKKADTKKADTAKPPTVIAVQPAKNAAPSKKAPTVSVKNALTPAVKAPEKTAAPKVSQTGPVTEKPKPAARVFGARGRRDPFVSPIVSAQGVSRPSSNCTSGKRCLVIPELVLQGTVKDASGKMMAVVANSTRRTYFLRENDQVFQGSVEKITSDSIVFREYVKDTLGRETAHEVVKKLVPPS